MKSIHNKYAPYWAITLVILVTSGLLTIKFDFGKFASGYLLDMVGPAWAYILFRGLYTIKADNRWTRFFTPNLTLLILVAVAFGIETLQYLKIYDSTFDIWDFPAYISILIPLYFLDKHIASKAKNQQ